MKYCPKCKAEKELSEFHKDRSREDGLKPWCKECRREYWQTDAQKETRHKTSRKYRQTDAGKAVDRKSSQKYQQTEAGKETQRKGNWKYAQLNPEKIKARNIVNHAITAGKLTRPNYCESCFKECKPDGHHEDYSRPLNVEWLCRECHKFLHRRILLCQSQT